MRSPGPPARIIVALLTIVGTAIPPLPGHGGEIVDRMLRGMAAPFKGRQRTEPAGSIRRGMPSTSRETSTAGRPRSALRNGAWRRTSWRGRR